MFDERDPSAVVICDPDEFFYRAFGLGRGTLRQLFGLEVWRRGFSAAFKGNSIGRPGGQNVWTMPGAFLVDSTGKIVGKHVARHAGDGPVPEDIVELSLRLST